MILHSPRSGFAYRAFLRLTLSQALRPMLHRLDADKLKYSSKLSVSDEVPLDNNIPLAFATKGGIIY